MGKTKPSSCVRGVDTGRSVGGQSVKNGEREGGGRPGLFSQCARFHMSFSQISSEREREKEIENWLFQPLDFISIGSISSEQCQWKSLSGAV